MLQWYESSGCTAVHPLFLQTGARPRPDEEPPKKSRPPVAEDERYMSDMRDVCVQYYAALVDEGYDDIQGLRLLDNDDLTRRELKKGHIKKLRSAMHELWRRCSRARLARHGGG